VTDVDVAILHLEPDAEAGPLTRATHVARLDLVERHRRGFLAAGATRVTLHAGPRDDVPFGARLRHLAADIGDGGLIVLGSGAIPLATAVDRRELVAAARQGAPAALANNRYSADVIAISRARSVLARLPDIATDNMLPRWLAEGAGVPVSDVRSRRRLGVDIDGPLDLILLAGRWLARLDPSDAQHAVAAIDAVRRVAADPDAELLVAGRVSGRTGS